MPFAAVGSVKASIGHLEPAAGLAGLARTLLLLSRDTAVGNAQLRVLNPMVAAATRGAKQMALWPVQLERGALRSEGLIHVGGVSSFGYSGTIAHCLLGYATHAVASASANAAVEAGGGRAALHYHRRAYLWSEPSHPLLQRRLPAPSGCAALFRSPVAGALHALVADHVVRGRIVVPGAAYLETCLLYTSPSPRDA